jgi:hypothetical protein
MRHSNKGRTHTWIKKLKTLVKSLDKQKRENKKMKKKASIRKNKKTVTVQKNPAVTVMFSASDLSTPAEVASINIVKRQRNEKSTP